ncbi:endonuclease/exonuclease/phosphatase family protein [Longitalea luteola]|uniref:endonuclease/exonuclease/phosphatase family protein n=1 Tax=Longitalea luteola TaxID=2812563 RepID=UPI001A96F4CE|nr:endonuclease/exonuclease/phosphatase family protein [Longitalea luteola]
MVKHKFLKCFLAALALVIHGGCNKDPYMPGNAPTYIELINNVNTYGKENDNDPVLSSIKVMTYNIHTAEPPAAPGVVNIDAIAKVIRDEAPDIVFLQEVDKNTGRNGYTKDQSAELGALTKMNVAYFSAINYMKGFYGVAILSKFPMSHIRKQLLPKGNAAEEQRVIGLAQVDLPGKDSLLAMVTHLQHDNEASRLLQVRELVNVASSITIPVVMGGDLNERPSATDFINVLDGGFTRTCTSCPNTFPASNATAVIDYLAYKPAARFSVMNHKAVMETYASDHLPVISELKINR